MHRIGNICCDKFRSSRRSGSVKKVFLKIFQNTQENTCAGVFFNKVAGLGPEGPFLRNAFGRLLLKVVVSKA